LFKIYDSVKFPKIPDGISRAFRNSGEFTTGIQGRVNPGNFRIGIPGGHDVDLIADIVFSAEYFLISRFNTVACRGGADGVTAPGIHPVGHPRGQFSQKIS